MELIKASIITTIFMLSLVWGQVAAKPIDHTEGHFIRSIFKAVGAVVVGPGFVTFANDTLEDLQKLGVDVELVDEIPDFPEATGFYSFKDSKIYLAKKVGIGSRTQTDILAAHEMVHYIRHRAGVFNMENKALEEYLACTMREEVAELLFGIKYRTFDDEEHFLDTIKVNGIKGFSIDLDEAKIEKEKTLELLKKLVGEK